MVLKGAGKHTPDLLLPQFSDLRFNHLQRRLQRRPAPCVRCPLRQDVSRCSSSDCFLRACFVRSCSAVLRASPLCDMGFSASGEDCSRPAICSSTDLLSQPLAISSFYESLCRLRPRDGVRFLRGLPLPSRRDLGECMHVWQISSFGIESLEFAERPEPEAGPGEVIVQRSRHILQLPRPHDGQGPLQSQAQATSYPLLRWRR